MYYVDTSVLVAYLVPEKYSRQADAALHEYEHQPLTVSAWVRTELVSALGLKCRTGQIDEAAMQTVLQQFRLLNPQFLDLPVTPTDFIRAEHLLGDWQTGLRAGDALHLAIAQRHGCGLLTLDRVLADSGNRVGLPTKWLADPSRPSH